MGKMIFEGNKIGLAADHAGFGLKDALHRYLLSEGYKVQDFGTNSEESCDYPDYAHKLGDAIENGAVACGIAVCGSGIGISIALNRHHGVRAALVWRKDLAELTRRHNNANVLALPGRILQIEEAIDIVKIFLSTPFDGGRHERRIKKIELDNRNTEET